MIRLFAFLILISPLIIQAQNKYFSGRISLNIEYYDSLGNKINPSVLGLDSISHYYIWEGNYKALNERGEITQLFNSSTNQYYFKNAGQIHVMDASFKYPSTGTVRYIDGYEYYLDRKCKILEIESETGITHYYYPDDIIINPQYYQNHNFGNWNLFLNSTKGRLALNHVVKSASLTITMKAYEIEEMEFSTNDFNILDYTTK